MFPFFVFITVFLLITNRHIFQTVLSKFEKPTNMYSRLDNDRLKKYILEKTKVKIDNFYLVDSDKPFATMTGIPGYPIMNISKHMYKNFSDEELNYVLLHETGHYVYWHTIKEIILQGSLLILAFFIFRNLNFSNEIIFSYAVITAIVIAIGFIQVARFFEWQADTYSLNHLDDPRSMISATKKFEKIWYRPKQQIIENLFYRSIRYQDRISHAKTFTRE